MSVEEIIRNSRLEVSCEKVVLENFAKFTGKHLCKTLFFNEVIKKGDSSTGAFLGILRNF